MSRAFSAKRWKKSSLSAEVIIIVVFISLIKYPTAIVSHVFNLGVGILHFYHLPAYHYLELKGILTLKCFCHVAKI